MQSIIHGNHMILLHKYQAQHDIAAQVSIASTRRKMVFSCKINLR